MLQIFKLMRNSAILLTSAFFFSCQTDTDIGLILDGDINQGAFETDTLSLTYGTYQMDSVITSGQNFALVGIANDPFFGKITASAYLQPTLETTNENQQGFFNFDYTSNIIPDSVELRLWNRTLTYFGDTLSKVTFNLHRLNAPIPSKNFNNDDALPYNPEVLASVSFDISDLQGDSSSIFPLRIKLPNSILDELTAIRGTDDAKDVELFQNKFGGFVIVPDESSKAVYAFNIGQKSIGTNVPPVSSLDYYFHNESDSLAGFYSFEFRGRRFNNIISQREGTPIAGLLNKRQIIDQSLTDGEIFVQSGTGTAAYIQFPGLNPLKNNVKIARAEVVFEVNKEALSEDFNIAPLIVPIELKSDGSVRRDEQFGYSYISSSLNQSTGNLGVYNDSLGTVSVDITAYIRELVTKNTFDSGVIFASGSTVASQAGTGTGIIFNGGLNRIILRKPRLKLLYSK